MTITTTVAYVQRLVLPAAYAILPPTMTSAAATAWLLAVGFQESRFQHRRQIGGPARGFWQFEEIGVAGLFGHPASKSHLISVAALLQYEAQPQTIHAALAHHDILAAVCARLLLWTVPAPLPARDDDAEAWRQYLAAWRPGRPHLETWAGYYAAAWAAVDAPEVASSSPFPPLG